MNASNPFPEVVRSVMDSKGLNQRELADILGITRPMISLWLNGEALPGPGPIEKLAELAGRDADELRRAKAIFKLAEEGIDLGTITRTRSAMTPYAARAVAQIESGDYTGAISTLAGLLGQQRNPAHALNDSSGGTP